MSQQHTADVVIRERFVGARLDVAQKGAAKDAAAGQIEVARQRTMRARDLIERAMSDGSATAKTLETYARALSESKIDEFRDIPKAVRIGQLAADQYSVNDPEALLLLASIYRTAGRTADAIATYQRALDCPSIEGSPKEKRIQTTIEKLSSETVVVDD